jgi:TonB family protein
VTAVADQLGGWRRREFRRLLVVSVALHIGGILLLGYTPTTSWHPAPGEVIAVEVVTAAPRAAAPPRPAPAPKPKPAPAAAPEPVPAAPPAPPPPPVKKQVVLPKQPEVPKPKVEPRPEPKPQPQRRELDPSEVQQRPAPTEDYEDVMAKLRAEAGEPSEAPAPTPSPAPEQVATAASPAAGVGRPVDPEVAAWMRRVKIHVRRSWVVPPGFRMQPLETRVQVRLDASGAVLGEPEILRRSGNPWYDEGVVRGIQKASPLPPPPEAGEWEFIFRPEDSY